MSERLNLIRKAEAESHTQAYTRHSLFSPGSWLAKPVKTVMELLPLFEGYTQFAALDLGSGVGRNCMQGLLENTFAGWQIIKHTIVHQKYDIPRENGMGNSPQGGI